MPNSFAPFFWHLLDNALKYSQAAPPNIQITSSIKNEWANISIRDHGCGIPVIHLQDVFDLFRRINVDENVAGDGFGLALCKRIIHRHGGRIWAERHREAGTSFHVRLSAVPDIETEPSDDSTESELPIL